MTSPATDSEDDVLDVRGIRKPDKHPAIFAAYADLPVGGAFVLVNDHDPVHLHQEFEAGYPGSFSWDYLHREMRDWRIRIAKVADAPRATTADGLAADRPLLSLDATEPASPDEP